MPDTEIEIPSMDNASDRFMVWAEAADHDKPLLVTDLTPARLFDDIVVPYQTGDRFLYRWRIGHGEELEANQNPSREAEPERRA